MELLRQFLKTLKTKPEKEEYAKSCGTSLSYLRKVISKGTQIDGALARLLDENSGHRVRKELLRPDIWPELLSTKERRHLTAGQKAAIAVDVLPLYEIEAKSRQTHRRAQDDIGG